MKENKVLVALVRTVADWRIIQNGGVYRIPVRSAPIMVKDGTIRYLAFYFPNAFGTEAFQVKWYGSVNHLKIGTRLEAVPNEPLHPRANAQYYLIGVDDLIELKDPFISQKPRRLLFIPTTETKFFQPVLPEINYLFNESPLESLLWDSFVERRIPAERQYMLRIGKKKYILDFAVFCKNKNLNIECDGDTWHNKKAAIENDKERNNLLESSGWSVLRFTTDKLYSGLPRSLDTIISTINRYGGVMEPNSTTPRYLLDDSKKQRRLFD